MKRKNVFFEVYFDEEIVYDHGRRKLNGIQFAFKKKIMPQFEEIVSTALMFYGREHRLAMRWLKK